MSFERKIFDQLVALLQEKGLPESEARTQAALMLGRLERVEAGNTYGGLHVEDIGRLWQAASHYGARRVVFEIQYEEPDPDSAYHLQVRVLEREDWPGPDRN
jgi:cytosine/adenosine deaminase-related metal-dependent hydrolase